MNCPVCSQKLPVVVKHIRLSEFTYYICPLCESYVLDPLPAEHDAKQIYENSEYFVDGYIGYFDSTDIQLKNFDLYVNRLAPLIKQDSLIAEIGSGSGAFILSLLNHGYRNVTGYELNTQARLKARDIGLDIRPMDELFQKSHPRIDLLCMFDVIEHVTNPADFLARCKDILQPDGHIAILTGNNKSIGSRLLGNMWWFLTPPDHCIIYTKNSMRDMLQRLGYQIFDIVNISCYFTTAAGIFNKIFHKMFLVKKPALLRIFDNRILKKFYVPIYHFSDFLIIAKNVVK